MRLWQTKTGPHVLAAVKWDFRTTKEFRKSLKNLSPAQQQKAKEVFAAFKKDPFARAQKKNRLSAIYKETVRGVHVEGDLIAIFVVRGDKIVSLDIDTHDIYK